jgi:hypothetical protein
MTELGNRIKKLKSAIDGIRADDQSYIDGFTALYRDGDEESLAALPGYHGGPGKLVAIMVKSISRMKDSAQGGVNV